MSTLSVCRSDGRTDVLVQCKQDAHEYERGVMSTPRDVTPADTSLYAQARTALGAGDGADASED